MTSECDDEPSNELAGIGMLDLPVLTDQIGGTGETLGAPSRPRQESIRRVMASTSHA